jgi:vancomycin resistance protein YoaR
MLKGSYSLDAVSSETIAEVADALKSVRESKAFPVPQLPGSVVRQRIIVQEIEEELRQNAISQVSVVVDFVTELVSIVRCRKGIIIVFCS